MQDNIAKRSLHNVLPYGIEANVVRIFYIWKEKGEYLQMKMKKRVVAEEIYLHATTLLFYRYALGINA